MYVKRNASIAILLDYYEILMPGSRPWQIPLASEGITTTVCKRCTLRLVLPVHDTWQAPGQS